MTDIKKYLGKIKLVENILRTLKPKEVIAHYSKIYLISFLKDNGFDFKENQLEFHRKKPEFKQIIYFGCSRNNITGHIIDFDMGFYNYCPRFQTWYNKHYGQNPVGGQLIIGNEKIMEDWNSQYQKTKGHGTFGYDLINHDIEHQFFVILENLQKCIIPYLNQFDSFEKIILNPNKYYEDGQFDLFSNLRQIEHCLFLGNLELARKIRHKLSSEIPRDYETYFQNEIKRIFKE